MSEEFEFEQMKVQLDEKEQLVEALTKRLEQAAEQLDRIRRTGTDRNLKVSGGGGASLSPEFLEMQTQMATDLQSCSTQLTEMQETGSLARIENQIGIVRDMIIDLSQKGQGLVGNGAFDPGQYDMPNDVSSFLDQVEETSHAESNGQETGTPESSEQPEDAPFDYNALKNSLLGTEAESGTTDSTVSDSDQGIQPSLDAGALLNGQPEEQIEELNPPEEISLDDATREQLCEAVDQRDAYISYLLRKLRLSQSLQISLPDWDSLQENEEELLKEVQKLSEQLNEQLRLSEVDHALERARLGREESRLQLLAAKLEKESRQRGDDQEAESEDSSDPTSSRWMRMLSMNKKSNPDSE